jgi:transposase
MLVQEVLARNMRDQRAVARYAGLTGSPDESGTRRKGWPVPATLEFGEA